MKEDDAVSTVVGVILMLGIVAILAAGAFVFIKAPEPTEVRQAGMRGGVINGEFWMTHQGPDDLPVESTTILIEDDDGVHPHGLDEFAGSLQDPTVWRAGERICISGPGASCPSTYFGALEVAVVSDGHLITTVKSAYGSAFLAAPGGIQNQCKTSWSLHVVGVEITNGPSGPDIPVYVATSTNGGTSYQELFGGQPVWGGEKFDYGVLEPGAVLATRGTADDGSFYSQYSSADDDPHVVTLVDGDPVPTHPGYGSQVGISDMLAPYVSNGVINIGDNEIMVLYEFTSDLTSSAADFQDLVIIYRSSWAGC